MKHSPKKMTCDMAHAERVSASMLELRRRAPLMGVMHPNWSTIADYRIMKLKGEGRNFSKIANDLGRARIAVEQRFHRLRGVKDIMKKLEAFGLSDKPYSMGSM